MCSQLPPAKSGRPAPGGRDHQALEPDDISPGDVVGIGIHTGNALRGYEVGRQARERGAWVVYGGIHATLFPEEPREHGAAHAVVKGDGDIVWAEVVRDCIAGRPASVMTQDE
jgi:radical SAM superfamily enzyme YgiQ (UPF0313 family)